MVFRDIRELPNDSTIAADVCIVGAGPAGIALARELTGSGLRICLLESGGEKPDPDTQRLSDLHLIDADFADPSVGRVRGIGGTAHSWAVRLSRNRTGVRYLPLNPIDFEARDWIPHSGWPFARSELDPYYARAQEFCGFERDESYEPAQWERASAPRLPLDESRIVTHVDRLVPRGPVLHTRTDELRRAEDVSVYSHATAVELQERATAGTGSVRALRVRCLNGATYTVEARAFVLAAHAVENARLLLVSNALRHEGIGNSHDLVGRFYMDHVRVLSGTLRPDDRRLFERAALYDYLTVDGAIASARLAPTEAWMREERVLNSAAHFVPRTRPHPAASGAMGWLHNFTSRARHRVVGGALLAIAQQRFRPPVAGDRMGHGWSKLPGNRRRFETLTFEHQVELAPNPDNRVQIGSSVDRLGVPVADLRWKWSELDLRSIRRTIELFVDEFAKSGIGHFEPAGTEPFPILTTPEGAHHPSGTTRMHRDPESGVVDPDCRVHGTANLFVAGTSVFPTVGYANPTLTIVALSIRLADHLKEWLRRGA